MSGYLDRLRHSAASSGNVLCLGLDPDPERIGKVVGGPGLAACRSYFDELLDGLEAEKLSPAAFKPNLAYFEQFGSPGLVWMEQLLERLRPLAPVILDAKRGDIGPSSRAYARALFEVWGADAVTVNPWMGRDSIDPFLEYSGGVYLLVRTSNPGSAELQTVRTEGGLELWEQLLGKIVTDWHRPGLGAVIGATRSEALARLNGILGATEFPLLIPGVGSQGGEASSVLAALPGERCLHRVNVSSSILYAFEKAPGLTPVAAAVAAFRTYAEQLKLS